jgi:hypothetical protein
MSNGVGIEIRRGRIPVDEASCNFRDVSFKLKSSWDRRGIRDVANSGGVEGEEGGEGNWLCDNREAPFGCFFSPKD